MPDEIVGFHAQQCAEKLLKAVLATHEIEFPRTHSLQYLLDRLSDNDNAPTPSLHAVKELYPYAIQFRYEAPLEDESLHRPSVLELLEQLRAWTIDQLSRR